VRHSRLDAGEWWAGAVGDSAVWGPGVVGRVAGNTTERGSHVNG
jgi:hypothetical protein